MKKSICETTAVLSALCSFILSATCAFAQQAPGAATAPNTTGEKSQPAINIVDRLACSSLLLCKQSTDKAFQSIAALGYRWVDLACLTWAPHVSVPKLLEDFDREASRVEAALKTNGLQVANLTFESMESLPFDQYEKQFRAVTKLAARLKARVINLMSPSPKSNREEMVARLRKLQAIASESGVILTLETHCFQITERPADALWLCQQVPGLGITLDPSHYYAGSNQGANFDELYPYVQGTGFRAGGKNWKSIQMPWGQGAIDFAAIIRKMEAHGYKGFYDVEYIEGFNEVDAVAESRHFIEWAKGLAYAKEKS